MLPLFRLRNCCVAADSRERKGGRPPKIFGTKNASRPMALKLHREQFKDVMEIVTIPSLQSLEIFVQGPKKWFAKCDKHYPSRFRQTSLATAVTNFIKPRTSHFFGFCTFHSTEPEKWLAPASVLLWLQTIFSAPVGANFKMNEM